MEEILHLFLQDIDNDAWVVNTLFFTSTGDSKQESLATGSPGHARGYVPVDIT